MPGYVLLVTIPAFGAACARPLATDRGPIAMRILPAVTRAAVGDSLVIQLQFTNTSSEPVRLWVAPSGRFVGWDLRLVLSGLRSGTRVLVPAIRHSLMYEPADSDMVVLPSGRRAFAVLALRGGEHLPDSIGNRLYAHWECYLPEEYAERVRTGTGTVHEAYECLSRPGEYVLSAVLDVSRSAMSMSSGSSGGRPPLFTGRLEARPVRVILTGTRH